MAGKEEKKAFVLRVSQSTLKDIERWASDEFRSLNGQIEFLLQKALKESGRLSKRSQQEGGDTSDQ